MNSENFLDNILQAKQSRVDSKLIREIVPIDRWINDSYYTGESGKLLYPFWKKHIINIFSRERNQAKILNLHNLLLLLYLYSTISTQA